MSELPQHLVAYLNEIGRRIASRPDAPFVIVSDQESAEFLGAHLKRDLLARVTFRDEAGVTPDFLPPKGSQVLATHVDRWVALGIHKRLVAAKRAGHVVSLAMRDRRLQMHPPGWEGTGIMYEGMFRLAATYAGQLRGGAFAEFGVFDGNTFAIANHALKDVCTRFFAYDSFAGIVGSMESENGMYNDGDYFCNFETFVENMMLAGVNLRLVTAVKGPFQETLNKSSAEHGLTDVAVAHIDVDVYEPAKLALDYLGPVLKQGALILFDDYDAIQASNQKGERRAVREWLRENPGFSLDPYRSYAAFGRSFIFDRGE